MFKRFIDVYGKDFQPLLGDKQYISDPFWDRPKEDENKVLKAREKGLQTLIGRREEISEKYGYRKEKCWG